MSHNYVVCRNGIRNWTKVHYLVSSRDLCDYIYAGRTSAKRTGLSLDAGRAAKENVREHRCLSNTVPSLNHDDGSALRVDERVSRALEVRLH